MMKQRRNKIFVGYRIAAVLLIAGCLSIASAAPVFALDASSYFSISYAVAFDHNPIYPGDSVKVTVTGKAICVNNLPLTVSEGFVKGRIMARHEATGATIELYSGYAMAISPFPNKKGEAIEKSVVLDLVFPVGTQIGKYLIFGELVEARVKAVLWFTVTSYLPSTETLATIDIVPVINPVSTPPPEILARDLSSGITSLAEHTDSQGVIRDAISAASENGNVTIWLETGTRVLDKDGLPLSEIGILPLEDSPPTLANATVVGSAYKVTPENATFYPAVNLTIAYDPATLLSTVNLKELFIATWDENTVAWEKLDGCIVDIVNHTITVPIDRSSIFAVLIQSTTPKANNLEMMQFPQAPILPTVTSPAQTPAITDINQPGQTVTASLQEPIITVPATPVANINKGDSPEVKTQSIRWWQIALVFGINIILLFIVLRLLVWHKKESFINGKNTKD